MKQISAAVLLATLLLAGCDNSTTKVPKAATKPASSSPTVGQMAPDIIGTDIDGVDFKLSDYKGKVVMVDFWGTW